MRRTVRASAMLVGTIIGVGIFGIPYAFSKIGFWPGALYLLVLGAVVLILNLSYGQVVLSTNGKHQLSGYAEKYLGKKGRILALISIFSGFYGALVAYLIKLGEFLFNISQIGNSFLWSIGAFAVLSLLIFLGSTLISRFQLFLGVLLISVIVLISIVGLPYFNVSNLNYFNPSFFFLPYGVILFALGGASIIPEMGGIFERSERGALKKSIIIGTIIPLVLYLIFALTVVGVTGGQTSDDAITGLKHIHPIISKLGAFLGILSMGSSFLSLGTILKDLYRYDFKLSVFPSWLLTCFIPLIIFLAGLKEFILLISVAGSLMGGFEGIVIIGIYFKSKLIGDKKPEYTIALPKLIGWLLIAVFSAGILYEIFYLAQKLPR